MFEDRWCFRILCLCYGRLRESYLVERMRVQAVVFCLWLAAPLAAMGDSVVDRKILTVVGQGKALATASLVEVELAVEVQGRDPLDVQQQLANHMQPVVDALQKLKVDALQTGSMNVMPQYSRDSAPVLVGYTGLNTITPRLL